MYIKKYNKNTFLVCISTKTTKKDKTKQKYIFGKNKKHTQ